MTEGLTIFDQEGRLLHAAPPPIVAELRYTVARLQLGDEKTGLPPRLGVVSALSGEGVSFVCRSLAAVLANDLEESVCLVDLNWWSHQPDSDGRPGVAQVVNGETRLHEAVMRTDDPQLSYLPAGSLAPSERPTLVRSPGLQDALDELGARFNYVLLDVPPLLLTGEALALARYSEGCLMVVKHGVTHVGEVRTALDHLSNVSVLGIVMNRVSHSIPKSLLRRIPLS